jgi:tyrosine-protein kinase Etk/Wzc
VAAQAPDSTSPALPPPVYRVADEVNIHALFDLLRAGRRTVFGVAAVVFVAALLACVLGEQSFRSSGVLRVNDERATPAGTLSTDAASSLLGQPDKVASEIEMIRSRRVLDEVLRGLALDTVVEPSRFPLVGTLVARLNGGRSEPVQALPGLGRWAWGGEQIRVESLEVAPELLGTSLTLVAEEGNGYSIRSFWGSELLQGRVGQQSVSADRRVKATVSQLRAAPGTRFTLTPLDHDAAIERLLDNLVVEEQGTGSGVVRVSFTAATPREAADVVNTLMDAYVFKDREKSAAEAARAVSVLRKKIAPLEKQLVEARKKLSAFQSGSAGSPDLGVETAQLLQSAVTLQMKEIDLQAELGKARQSFGPRSTAIRQLEEAIAAVRAERDSLAARLRQIPSTQQELAWLAKDVERLDLIHNTVDTAIINFEVSPAGSVGSIWIVDPAIEVRQPVFPRPSLLLPLALLLGPLLGAAVVLGRRALLRGLDNPEDVEEASGLTVQASVPFSARQARLDKPGKGEDLAETRILALHDPADPAIDALGVLAVGMPQAGVVMICGPAPAAGKTFLAANLGVMLARAGRSVVIVDADLRRGTLHAYFRSPQEPGIGEYLSGSASVGDMIRRSPVQGLDWVSCGERYAGSYERLRSPAFIEFLATLEASHDVVLVTAPAVLMVPDAMALGKLAAAAYLVVGAAHHRAEEIARSVRKLGAAGVRLEGVVLNRVGELAGSHGYRGYGVIGYGSR